ncbi:MAG TPA: hypothetical protein VF329_10645 [Gammaproteobacteria bacterium]
MIHVGASNADAVIALLGISFLSFLTATAFRLWPEKILTWAEGIDGSLMLLSEAAHRALIAFCARALTCLSFVALVAAAFLA